MGCRVLVMALRSGAKALSRNSKQRQNKYIALKILAMSLREKIVGARCLAPAPAKKMPLRTPLHLNP